MKKREPKERKPVTHECAYCKGDVTSKNGGQVTIPLVYSRQMTQTVWAHNKCLNPMIDSILRNRPPLGQFLQPEEK